MAAAAADTNASTGQRLSPFFRDYRLLWTPMCAERTAAELKADEALIQAFAARCRAPLERAAGAAKASLTTSDSLSMDFSFEDRVLTRCLLYCVLSDDSLRAMVDGFLLPPPFTCGDMSARLWSPQDVHDLVQVLDPERRLAVALMPFNMALRLGSYDARLRVASHRLCWIFNLPCSVIERQEQVVAEVHEAMLREGAGSQNAEDKQKDIEGSKQSTKVSFKRVATIGGFALLGGGALVLTGGLAAPLIAPAYGALVSATVATLGAIGTVGSALLGGGALAALFAGAVGVATHAAALAGILSPVLTAANVTAIFGVTGAALGGYKAMRRTGETDVLAIRSIDEIESFEQPSDAIDSAEVVKSLADSDQAVVQNRIADMTVLNTLAALPDMVEDGSQSGVVVPSHTRSVAMAHAKAIKVVRKRRRSVVFALDNQFAGFSLRLKATHVVSGVWALTPPQFIPEGHSGVCACVNRWARPTGTGFILCYEATPTTPQAVATRSSFRLWVRVFVDTLNAFELTSLVENLETELDPFAAEYYLEEKCSGKSYTRTQRQVVMEMHRSPFTYLRVYLANDAEKCNSRPVTFPIEELPQRELEYMHDVKERRKVGVSVLNRTGQHTIHVVDFKLFNGAQWPQTASPMRVNPGEASLTAFTNSSWSLQGAEGYYILEIVNGRGAAIHAKYFLRFQFEVSATKSLNYAVAVAATTQKLKQMELTPSAPESTTAPVDLPSGLFFSAAVRIDKALHVMELQLRSDVERRVGEQARCASLSVGVCGFSTVFDPRRPTQDQQVGLWQPVLRQCQLFGRTEAYALQWEDGYLTRFGDAIHIDLDLANHMSSRVTGTLTRTVKKQLMNGALFAGMNAYKSFLGAFQLPLYAVWAADVIDNAFAVLSNRAVYAGKDLAVALLDEARGRRPVSLVGFSFGAKVIVECLSELERVDALSVVENVYLLGGTFPADPALWQRLRRVVAGRLVNVYTRHDWALWMMYKANDVNMKPMAGITAVNVPGVENVDLTPLVLQHSEYASRLADVLDAIPARPTEETWNPKNRLGSPGIVAPHRNAKALVRSMGMSFSSVVSNAPFCAFGVRNSLVTDIDAFDTSIEFVDCSVFDGFFDFLPPHDVDAAHVGVFGAQGNPNKPMAGALVFRLHLRPFAEQDVFFIVFFYGDSRDDARVTVEVRLMDPGLAESRCSPLSGSPLWETSSPVGVASDDGTAEAVREVPDGRVYDPDTDECLATRENQHLATILHECTSSLEEVRTIIDTSAHVVSREDRCAEVSIPVVMVRPFMDGGRTSSVKVKLERQSGGVVLNVLALFTEVSTSDQRQNFTERIYEKTYGVYSASLQRSTVLPATAQLHPLDALDSVLRELGAQIRTERNRVRTAGGTMYADRPIVIVNCGEVPLYFGEEDFRYAGEVKYGAVQWMRFPPPEIPPRMFTIMVVKNFRHGGVFPTIRYETVDESCGFDVVSTVPTTDVTVKRGIQCYTVAEFPLVGEVTLTSVQHSGVSFHVVHMTPVTPNTEAERKKRLSRTKQEKLKDAGWYVKV